MSRKYKIRDQDKRWKTCASFGKRPTNVDASTTASEVVQDIVLQNVYGFAMQPYWDLQRKATKLPSIPNQLCSPL